MAMTATESVVILGFPQSSPAYQALSDLRGLSESLTSVEVRSAALVERGPDGTLRVPEQADAVIGDGTVAGGLIGTLVGVLGGRWACCSASAPERWSGDCSTSTGRPAWTVRWPTCPPRSRPGAPL
jgi:hypothetical protein